MSPPPDALHWAGCAHGEPATWDARAVTCKDCICDTRFLRAVLALAVRAAIGVVTDAARWASVKLHAWAVETRASLAKPPPPEQPCRATQSHGGGFVLVCAWREHGEPEHCDPVYGVWTAHGSGAPR
jgi:hypothetical protein